MERWSHYLQAAIAEQFGAVIHLDETSALQPLEPATTREVEEVSETFPSGRWRLKREQACDQPFFPATTWA